MNLPTPEDMAHVPVWENYIVAQTVQATLGIIPEHALAVGVEVAGIDVRIHFQLSQLTEEDREDMQDTLAYMEGLVGNDIQLQLVHEIRPQRLISPLDGIRWIFLARA